MKTIQIFLQNQKQVWQSKSPEELGQIIWDIKKENKTANFLIKLI